MSKAFERVLFILIIFLGIILFVKCETLALEKEYEVYESTLQETE